MNSMPAAICLCCCCHASASVIIEALALAGVVDNASELLRTFCSDVLPLFYFAVEWKGLAGTAPSSDDHD